MSLQPPPQYQYPAPQPQPSSRGAFRSALVLIAITWLISCIPGLGFSAWILAVPVLFICFILAIVAFAKGSTGDGLVVLFLTMIGGPIAFLVSPLISTAIAAKALPTPAPEASATPAAEPTVAHEIQTLKPRYARKAPTGPEVDDAQRRAIQRYPDVGIANSPVNQRFVTLVRKAETERPEVFDNPEWPTVLAKEASNGQ